MKLISWFVSFRLRVGVAGEGERIGGQLLLAWNTCVCCFQIEYHAIVFSSPLENPSHVSR